MPEYILLEPLDSPFELFARWMDDAIGAEFIEPRAMTLATVASNGRPSARQVLLKEHDESGFIFYTNYESRKAEELNQNPNASAVLWWDKLYRQVRIEGSVQVLSKQLSDDYFATRPRGSQISARASPQSKVIDSFRSLQIRVAELEFEFKGEDVPRPDNWGGYRLAPDCIEFWQGRQDRLHERIRYRLQAGIWISERLAP